MVQPHHSIQEWDQHVNIIARYYLEDRVDCEEIAARLTQSGFPTKESSVKRCLRRWQISRKANYQETLARCSLFLRNQGRNPCFTRYGEQVPMEEIEAFLQANPGLEAATNDTLPGHLLHLELPTIIPELSIASEKPGDQTAGLSETVARTAKRKRSPERLQKKVRYSSTSNSNRPRESQSQTPIESDSESSSASEVEPGDDNDQVRKNAEQDSKALQVKRLKKTLKGVESLFSNLSLRGESTKEALQKLKEALAQDVDALKQKDAREYTERAPLIMLINLNQIDLVRRILIRGADVNAKCRGGIDALHMAAYQGHFDILSLLLQQDGIDIDAVDDRGQTALHLAVDSGRNPDCALLLIRSGASVDLIDDDKDTALHNACRRDRMWEVIPKLAEMTRCINARNKYGSTPLHYAAAVEWGEEYVKVLIEKGADLNVRDENGQTPMHQACFKGSNELLAYMISQKANLTIKGNQHETVLHLLCQRDISDITRTVVETEGVDINAKSLHGITPLCVAASNNSLDTVKMLVEHNADTTIVDVDRDTALITAIRKRNFEVAAYLIDCTNSPLDPQGTSPKKWKTKADSSKTSEQAFKAPMFAHAINGPAGSLGSDEDMSMSHPHHSGAGSAIVSQVSQMIPQMINYLNSKGYNVTGGFQAMSSNVQSPSGRKPPAFQGVPQPMLMNNDHFQNPSTALMQDFNFNTPDGFTFNSYPSW